MKITYVTRKFPPSIGGMETASYELYQAFVQESDEVQLIKWGGKNIYLPAVFPYLLIRTLVSAWSGKADVVYIQDGVLALLGSIVKKLTRAKTVITVHGLEVQYQNTLYRKVFMPHIARQDYIACVSSQTKDEVVRIFPNIGSKIGVVNNGITDRFFDKSATRNKLQELLTQQNVKFDELQGKKILYTSGRLVKRKGVAWFVKNVMPAIVKTNTNVIYFVTGSGEDEETIKQAISKNKLEAHVYLLGRVSDELRNTLYSMADLFVMPNIPVKNDMEGFGLVAIEASSTGLPVVAAKLEGIQDAVISGKNGFLIEPQNSKLFAACIEKELAKPSLNKKQVRDFTLKQFAWSRAARKYQEIIKNLN